MIKKRKGESGLTEVEVEVEVVAEAVCPVTTCV